MAKKSPTTSNGQGCDKSRFDTAEAALNALIAIVLRGQSRSAERPSRYYYHPKCNGFHLTHHAEWQTPRRGRQPKGDPG